LVADLVNAAVDVVARGTGNVADIVNAARPQVTSGVLPVATEAGFVLRARRRRALPTEGDVRLGLGTRRFGVALAVAVAARAGRRTAVGPRPVLRPADAQELGKARFIVAGRALRISLELEI